MMPTRSCLHTQKQNKILNEKEQAKKQITNTCNADGTADTSSEQLLAASRDSSLAKERKGNDDEEKE